MNISLPGGADATVGAAGGYVQVIMHFLSYILWRIIHSVLQGGGHRQVIPLQIVLNILMRWWIVHLQTYMGLQRTG